MRRLLIHELCRPCFQVFAFGRSFHVARTTNFVLLGTSGCVGLLILLQIVSLRSSFIGTSKNNAHEGQTLIIAQYSSVKAKN